MSFAYTPDQFGHIAALPMLMTGLGLQAGICWRGAQDENYPAMFQWVGPDGSRMPTYKLRDDGSYAPFLFKFRNRIEGDALDDSLFEEHFKPYFNEERQRCAVPIALLLDAIDHYPADERSIAILKKLEKLYPDVEFVWASLEEFGRDMAAHADELPERMGELREPCRTTGRGGQYLIVHTLSSRYPLKKANDECQAMLEYWVEPIALMSRMRGGQPNLHYLELGLEYLLKNHATIPSADAVSIRSIAASVPIRPVPHAGGRPWYGRTIAESGEASVTDKALANVVVHNPLPYEREGASSNCHSVSERLCAKYVDGLKQQGKPGRSTGFGLSCAEHWHPVPFSYRASN